jgi:DNA topoisomerase-1
VGKDGHVLACAGYPECTYSSDYERDEKGVIAPVAPVQSEPTDKLCNLCGKPMVIKRGRYGSFLACTGYPECKHTQSLNGAGSGKPTGMKCPAKGCDGEIVEKSSKRGKIFFGCNRYPKCEFATWDKPVAMACPVCGNPYMVEKTTKRHGTQHVCPNRECGHRQPAGDQ